LRPGTSSNKLHEAAKGQPTQWVPLRGMNELRATVARAVERGRVTLQGAGKLLQHKAALSDEGRRLAYGEIG
jgi:hypothetical protein